MGLWLGRVCQFGHRIEIGFGRHSTMIESFCASAGDLSSESQRVDKRNLVNLRR